MIPGPGEILRRRATATMVLRLFASAVACVALIPFGIWLAEGIADGDFFDLTYYTMNIVGILVILGGAATIWALSGWVGRLAVPTPRVHICPACRYRLLGLNTPQCPECGLTLTPEFMTAPGDPAEPVRRGDLVLLRQIATLAIRIGSLAAALPVSIYLFNMLMLAITDPTDEHLAFAVPPVVATLAVVAAFLLAPRIAIAAVPRPDRLEALAALAVAAAVCAVAGLVITLLSLYFLGEGVPRLTEIIGLLGGASLIVAAFPLAGMGLRGGKAKPTADAPRAPEGHAEG